MSYISDELRKHAKRMRNLRIFTYKDPSEYEHLADRIDEEMVELPKDADGKPIHVGDTVYDKDGNDGVVCTLTLNSLDGKWLIGIEDMDAMCGPNLLTHECPDSWSRIADELDEWRFEHMRDLEADGLNDMSLFADRIRRLAKERGHEHE